MDLEVPGTSEMPQGGSGTQTGCGIRSRGRRQLARASVDRRGPKPGCALLGQPVGTQVELLQVPQAPQAASYLTDKQVVRSRRSIEPRVVKESRGRRASWLWLR